MGGHVERKGERRGKYRILVGKTEGKKTPESPRRRWKDNTKMDAHGGVRDMGYTNRARDRERWLSSCKRYRELLDSIICGEFLV